MEKKTLNFRAEEQSLIGLNAPARFASRTVSYIKAVFELGENWHGYDSVRAVWTTDFASICTVLDSFGACTVPHEVLDRVGRVYVNLVGSIAENNELTDRLTTYPLEAICIDASAVVCGSETAEITPSQFEQFADAVRSDADRAETGARDAESARADAIDARDAASASQYLASRYAVQSADSANASAQSARESADSATTSAQSAGDARESAEDAERAKDAILGMRAEAETLPAGSDATASYSDGVLSLGIPKGDTGAKGAKGDKGDTGATPDIEIGTVSTLEPGESATATITGTAERPILSLGIPKGAQGDVGMAEFLDAVTVDELSDSVPYKLKATPADAGSREILRKIVGGTVAWNQICGDISTQTRFGITCTNNGNGSLTFNGTSTGRTQFYQAHSAVHLNAGDKVLMLANNLTGSCSSALNIFFYFIPDDGSATQYPAMGVYGADGTLVRTAYIRSISKSGMMRAEGGIVDFVNSGTTVTNLKFTPQVINLTQMFGSTIADYIYSLEQANAGAGVAFFRKLFPKDYYEYNAGELISVSGLESHDTVGFNAFDVENAQLAQGNWTTDSLTPNVRTDAYTKVIAGAEYNFHQSFTSQGRYLRFYDADYNWIEGGSVTSYSANDFTFTVPSGAVYMRIMWYHGNGTTVSQVENGDVCINLSWPGYRNGEYEPYEKHSYPLDNSLTLRGIPKLDSSNNLYYDGDEYASDGTVTRRYGVVDLGTLTYTYDTAGRFYTSGIADKILKVDGGRNLISNKFAVTSRLDEVYNGTDKVWSSSAGNVSFSTMGLTDATAFKTAMSGVYLVYELATPTTETAEPYTQIQSCEAGGTEEFVTDGIVPVGNESIYPRTLADTMPRTDGTYTIGLTVSGGKRVVGWVQS